MARQAVRLNACTEIALTKLDVLDELETIKVCVAYEVEVKDIDLPHLRRMHDKAVPVYAEFPGWQTNLSDATERSDLPREAVEYISSLNGRWAFLSALFAWVGTRQYLRLRHEDLRGRLREPRTRFGSSLSPHADVLVTPGSPGIKGSTEVTATEIEADLYVVGPEIPLVEGLADLRSRLSCVWPRF